MNWKLILLIFGIMVLVNSNNVSAIDIDNCISVQNDTTYTFNQSIITTVRPCFNIQNLHNITIDGNGYILNITNGNGQSFWLENITNITIKNLNVYVMNCTVFNQGGISSSGDITNLYLTNNTWHICGSHYFHVKDTGNIYNTTTIGDSIYIYNYTNPEKYQSLFWWTNSNIFTFWNNYIEVHHENDGTCHGNYILHGNNTDLRNVIHDIYGIPCSPLSINSYGSGQGEFSNSYIENYSIECKSINGCESIDSSSSFAIYGIDNITIKNSYIDTYGINTIQYSNNILLENNYLRGNYYPLYLKNIINGTINNLTSVLRKNLTEFGDNSYYSVYIINSNDINFENITIDGNNSIYYGIRIGDSIGTINNSYIGGETSGIDVRGNSNFIISNSELNVLLVEGIYPSGGSIKTRNNAIVNLYNVSMNDEENIKVVDTSQINVYWKLNLDNLFNSSVKLYDSLNNLILDSTNETLNLWVKEYNIIPENQKTDLTPHNLEWEKSGYYNNFTLFNMNINKNLILYLIEKANVSFQLPFEITGMYLSESRCLDNETLYRKYTKESCIYTECYELSDIQTIICPYGCREDITIFGDECFYPDYQTYFIFIVIIILIFIGLGIISKR